MKADNDPHEMIPVINIYNILVKMGPDVVCWNIYRSFGTAKPIGV